MGKRPIRCDICGKSGEEQDARIAALTAERNALRRGHKMKDREHADYEDAWAAEVANLRAAGNEMDDFIRSWQEAPFFETEEEWKPWASEMNHRADGLRSLWLQALSALNPKEPTGA
jgi:hypothetical protein